MLGPPARTATFIPTPIIHQERRLSMLVLSRKQNERIRVGDSVVVTVVRVSGDKVRIGIEAPANVRVLRAELEEESMGTVTLEPSAELPIPRLLRFVG
jgi:carbon storage regulator